MARQSDENGRWVKAGGKVAADGSAPPTAVVVVPARRDPEVKVGVQIVSVGFAVDFDPVAIVDAMTRAAMAQIRSSILAGQRPDGKGAQKALSRQALADPDRESPHRAFNTGELADNIRRTPIKSTATGASSTVLPPTSRTVYVAKEKARGVVLLTTAGAVGEAAAAAAQEALAVIAEGRSISARPGEVRAKDAER
jgi:hypothetical protein